MDLFFFFSIFFILFIIVCIKASITIKNISNYVNWNAQYLQHKTSCFDCEKQMINTHGEEGAWMGQPTKSFDAEKEARRQGESGFLAKTLKYY